MRSNDATPRVVFINPWDKRIGPNRYLADLLRQSPALAHNSIVILPNADEAADEYRAMGCQVEVWQDARLVHVKLNIPSTVKLLRIHTLGVFHAWRRFRSWRVQLVLTNSENVWFGGMAAFLSRIPHIQVFHALTLEHHWGAHPRSVRWYLRFLSLWSTRFIAVSNAVAEMLNRNGVASNRVFVLPNALDITALTAASQHPLPPVLERLIEDHSPLLVSLGRISALKGQDLLVEALPQVKEKFPKFLCLFGGQLGSDEGVDDTQSFYRRLQLRIRELGLEENVSFLGEIDYAPALLRRANVYVQPSRSESFCRAVAEALVCSTPIVAFRVGGIPEIVGNSGGMLVEPGDTFALADAIVKMASDPSLQESTLVVGRRNVREKFDAKCVAELFRQILQGKLSTSRIVTR